MGAQNLDNRDDYRQLIVKVSRLVQNITGVQLGARQHSMVESRLKRRMLDLGLTSVEQYQTHLDQHTESECRTLVFLLTTHHTFFFREFEQFEFLRDQGLAAIAKAMQGQGRRHLKVWSMACSRGQEAYSLSMFLLQHWSKLMPGGTFEILGTDVDAESVAVAKNGVYPANEIKSVPAFYAANHWSRGTGDIAAFVRAKEALRQNVRFEAGNLLDIPQVRNQESFDLIFCRNVFIYFTPEQIASICNKILPHLGEAGYFFIGSTESLSGMKLPFKYLGTSVYSKAKPTSKAAITTPVSTAPALPVATPKRLIRVFCVDDSPTIHTLLKAILTQENGFEIVATAVDGQDAATKAAKTNFDVMTLDIHMPIKSGIDYLRDHLRPGHPPVVVISSISREETTLGIKALELGAIDYVEKPSMSDIKDRGDEIRTKLRCAAQTMSQADAANISKAAAGLAKELEHQSRVTDSSKTLRVIACGVGDRSRLLALIKALGRPQPPTFLFVEGPEAMTAAVAANLQKHCSIPVKVATSETVLSTPIANLADHVWVVAATQANSLLGVFPSGRRTICLIYDSVSSKLIAAIKAQTKGTILLEEPLQNVHPDADARRRLADRAIPYTSLLFDGDYLLNKE